MKSTVNTTDRKDLARAVLLLNSWPAKRRLILEMILLVKLGGPRAKPLDAREQRALKEMQRRHINPLKEVRGKPSVSNRIIRAHLLHTVNFAIEKCLCFPRFEDWRYAQVRWVPDPSLSEAQARIANAIQVFISLAIRGLLFRLRRCGRPSCGRWFDGPEKKKFHSVDCRKLAFLESDSGKDWRKNYQRQYMKEKRDEEKEEERSFFKRQQASRNRSTTRSGKAEEMF
jgi:hypothetical protein